MEVTELAEILAASPPEPYVRTMARLADEDPGFVAVSCEDQSITRRGLEERSNRLARTFQDQGVELGDYVAMALPNGIEYFVAFFAALKVGAVPLPMSYRLPTVERQAILDLAGAALLIGEGAGEHPGLASLPADFVPDASVSAEPLPEVVSPSWKAPTSGGSTGRPKIIRAAANAVGSPAINQLLFRYVPEDTQAVVAPLYHNSALVMAFGGLLLGQHLVVLKKFDAEETLRLVEQHRITWLMLVPTMMHRMLRILDEGRRYDLSSIRILWHAASKCPEWLKLRWIEMLGADKVLELYGGTESIAMTVITGEEWLEHRGSVGKPVVGDMKVLGADGTELAPGEIGEIYMKGIEGMPSYEYVGAEARSIDGWETLGDLGWKDDDGFLYISDRRVDMIVSGGANVFPAEVESALAGHPGIADVVVIGLSDTQWGRRVHAVIQVAEGAPLTEQQVIEYAKSRLAHYKAPKTVEFVDAIPRTAATKVNRSAMIEARGG